MVDHLWVSIEGPDSPDVSPSEKVDLAECEFISHFYYSIFTSRSIWKGHKDSEVRLSRPPRSWGCRTVPYAVYRTPAGGYMYCHSPLEGRIRPSYATQVDLVWLANLFRRNPSSAPPDVRKVLEKRDVVIVDGTGEQVPLPLAGQEARDAFMYAEHMKGADLKQIHTAAKLQATANRWLVPTTLQGIQQAIVRYSERNQLPHRMHNPTRDS
jgi:hypothetical protein